MATATSTNSTRQPVIRVSNSFTRIEIRLLKEIIDTATTADFRGRNQLLKYIHNPDFSQLYRKVANMQEKADKLHSDRRETKGSTTKKSQA